MSADNPANGLAFTYDAAGNITYDGSQTFTYDAAGKQRTSSWNGLQQVYDGDGLRGKKVMDGAAVYYLHSSVLGGQVVAEVSAGGAWTRGYVHLGGAVGSPAGWHGRAGDVGASGAFKQRPAFDG